MYAEWSVSQPGMRRLFLHQDFLAHKLEESESQNLSDIFFPGLPPASLSPFPLAHLCMHSFSHLVNNHTLSILGPEFYKMLLSSRATEFP